MIVALAGAAAAAVAGARHVMHSRDDSMHRSVCVMSVFQREHACVGFSQHD